MAVCYLFEKPVLVALVVAEAHVAGEEHHLPLLLGRQSTLEEPPRCARLQQLVYTWHRQATGTFKYKPLFRERRDFE